jgi:hypothetical protein
MKTFLTAAIIGVAWSSIATVDEHSDARVIHLRMAGCDDTANVVIKYFLTGPFGGYADFVRTRPGRAEYAIETFRENQAAQSFRAFIWCRGRRIVLLSAPSLTPNSTRTDIRLQVLKEVRLSGKLIFPTLDALGRVRIEVEYSADWTNLFFGVPDGGLTQFIVASAAVASDGSFEMMVPDFANDPVVAQYESRGTLRLIVRETNTGNTPYTLEQVQYPGHAVELAIAPAYAQLELYAFSR